MSANQRKFLLHQSMKPLYELYSRTFNSIVTALENVIESACEFFKLQVEYTIVSAEGDLNISVYPDQRGVDSSPGQDMMEISVNDSIDEVEEERDNEVFEMDEDGSNQEERIQQSLGGDEDGSNQEERIQQSVGGDEDGSNQEEHIQQSVGGDEDGSNQEERTQQSVGGDEDDAAVNTNEVYPVGAENSVAVHGPKAIQDLLVKYKNEEELLFAIELMKYEFVNEEVEVPTLITHAVEVDCYRIQFQKLGKAMIMNESQLFYTTLQKGLLYLVYYLQWQYLKDNNSDTYRMLKGEMNSTEKSRYEKIIRVGTKINYLCKNFGMSSLSLLSVISFAKLARCTGRGFKELTEHEVVHLVSHRQVNNYLESFRPLLLDKPIKIT